MGKIVVVTSQKGGPGKSTVATNLASGLSHQGYDVMLVDADRQMSALRWSQDRAEKNPDLPLVHSVACYDDIRPALKDTAGRYDFVVVDTAGRDSKEMRLGMTVADQLVVPFRPSQFDLDTLMALSEIVTEAMYLNPTLDVRAILNMAPTHRASSEASDGLEYLAEYPVFKTMKTVLHDRKVYRDAIEDGRGVVEMKNDKAADEIRQLVQELLDGKTA
ncbi:MAG: AAA family ATPase [Marinobacterium sp.]|nr:AAA family ATPase [Marinobacterium sp.]